MFISPHLIELAKFQSGQDATVTQSPLAAYFSSISALSGTLAPARGVARASAEAVGYMSRRTVATMDSANRMSRCRTPKDLIDEQNRFWTVAMQQYVETSARMMAAWGQATALPVDAITFPTVTRATDTSVNTHDVIMLPETKGSQRSQRPMLADADREAA